MIFIRDDIDLFDFVGEDEDEYKIWNAGSTADEIELWFLGA